MLLATTAVAAGMLTACSATETASPATPDAAARQVTKIQATTSAPPSQTMPVPGGPTSPSIDNRSREHGPDLLRDHTQPGAEAYVEDYLHRLDGAWTRPQASLLDNRASKTCRTCTNFRNAAAELARKGERHEAPMLVVSNVSLVIWRPNVRVIVDARQPDHDIVDKAGRKVRSVEGGRAYLYVQLTYRGRWWITAVGIDPVNDDGTHREP